MNKPMLLIVDDDRNTREGLEKTLRDNYVVLLAESGEKALSILEDAKVDLMLSDIRMPGMDGLTLLQRALARPSQPACVLMTAYGSIDKAVEAMKRGAADYITKPYNLDDLEMRLGRVLKSRKMETENASLQEQLDRKYGMENIVGNSDAMQRVYETIRQAAPTNATVLISGESGSGKELVAHAIHRLSNRAHGSFVAVHCAAFSQNLIESELFGHEKGAFTGAHERRLGRFEMADGGTFFLDEISEIPAPAQAKLLRVLEQRSFERVGGSKSIEVDIRLIAATNKNLKTLSEEGSFREDLYYRLNVVNIDLPPLRERRGDIPLLAMHFLKHFSAENAKDISGITPEAMDILSACPWQGNVRELRNAMEKMVIFARGTKIAARDIPIEIRGHAAQVPASARQSAESVLAAAGPMDLVEKNLILATLKSCNGNKTAAAEKLGISRRTLHRKIRLYKNTDSQKGPSDQ